MKTALIIVDVQNDFCPGGALAVPHGDEVVAPLNRWIEKAEREGWFMVATRDWHPKDHCSFKSQGGPWPAHCVAGTPGADFHYELYWGCIDHIVLKATARDQEAYSGFRGTDLAKFLRARGIIKVVIGGLATDYCVKATALDAKEEGFETCVLLGACRAVNVNPGDGDKAVEEMKAAGVQIVLTEALSEGE